MFFRLYTWHQIALSTTNNFNNLQSLVCTTTKTKKCSKSTVMRLKYDSTRLSVDKKITTSLCLVSLLLTLKNNSHVAVTLLLTLNKYLFTV